MVLTGVAVMPGVEERPGDRGEGTVVEDMLLQR